MLPAQKEIVGMEVKIPATQLIYAPFHCTRLSRNVVVTSIQFFSAVDGGAAVESEEEVVFDCGEKKACGVCTEFGKFRNYNWELCSNPELKKTVSE
jgi:hypothetical protein